MRLRWLRRNCKAYFNPFLSILHDPSTHPEEITSQHSNPGAVDAVFLITPDEGDGTRLNGFIPRYQPIEDAPGSDPDPIVFESKIKRALLLEDDQGVRELVSMFLQSQGFDVTEVESEKEVDLLEDLNFDFMVSDVMLPGKAIGPEVVQKTRTTIKNLPVLFISGYSHGALSSGDLNKPNTDFLEKPFSKAEFIAKIKQLLA